MAVRGVGSWAGGCDFKIYIDVWQGPTQYSKAVILQLNINEVLKKKVPLRKWHLSEDLELKGQAVRIWRGDTGRRDRTSKGPGVRVFGARLKHRREARGAAHQARERGQTESDV